MKRYGGLILSLFFLLYFILFVGISMGYSSTARRMPLVVGLPGVLMGLMATTRAIKELKATEETSLSSPAKRQRSFITMALWLFLLILAIGLLGFFLGLPLYTFLFMRKEKEKWMSSLKMAGLSFAILYLLFNLTLRIELYPGLLFMYLFK